ncbi:hypothetical protein [Parvibium lacunae]|uniref:Uncharacterized protein n=1 Tax=Parvibium lacunae TaxID=1888893 RepID=A0A368L0D0_9BURK|nr:hypothetical protein [Parvibium lacunae]RCS56741.1 hypothetical protein DU000_10340 [Parvibium lacunae]
MIFDPDSGSQAWMIENGARGAYFGMLILCISLTLISLIGVLSAGPAGLAVVLGALSFLIKHYATAIGGFSQSEMLLLAAAEASLVILAIAIFSPALAVSAVTMTSFQVILGTKIAGIACGFLECGEYLSNFLAPAWIFSKSLLF